MIWVGAEYPLIWVVFFFNVVGWRSLFLGMFFAPGLFDMFLRPAFLIRIGALLLFSIWGDAPFFADKGQCTFFAPHAMCHEPKCSCAKYQVPGAKCQAPGSKCHVSWAMRHLPITMSADMIRADVIIFTP